MVEIAAERGRRTGHLRDAVAEIAAEPTEGAVSLVVRFDPVQKAHRFEFRDEDYPDEVVSTRQHRIRQLTILADKDVAPWELLYPLDPGHDAGFLVERFPVTRSIFRADGVTHTLRLELAASPA
jgi:hypothetical protein